VCAACGAHLILTMLGEVCKLWSSCVLFSTLFPQSERPSFAHSLHAHDLHCGVLLQANWTCLSQCTCVCCRLCIGDWQEHGWTVHTMDHTGSTLAFRWTVNLLTY